MQTITSTKNQTVQKLVQLKTKKGRDEQGLYLIEGTRLVREAMLQRAAFAVLAISDEEDEVADIIGYAQSLNATVLCVSSHVISRICDTENPQGIVAAVKAPIEPSVFGDSMLALDHIADPGNLGTMLRSATAFGITDVMLSEGCADAFSPKCVRAGMGAHFRLNIREADLASLLAKKKSEGYAVIGASVNGKEDFPKTGRKRIYVIGSEAHGLTEDVSDACTLLYRIPMTQGSESLNAAVAAGILLFLGFSGQNKD